MSFHIHVDRLPHLAALVGLEHDVSVRKVHYVRSGLGRYVDFRDGCHRISVLATLDPPQALRTVLHEFGHALQCERLGGYDKFMKAWWFDMEAAGITPAALRSDEVDWVAYNRTPLEREANELAHRWMAESETIIIGAVTVPKRDLRKLYDDARAAHLAAAA